MSLAEVFIPLGGFAMVGYIVFIIVDSFRRRAQLRMVGEFHSKLLDRVGSASELVEFFGTESGARFLQSLDTERAPAGAHVRILRATQTGIVLVALGLGLFALMTVHANDYPRRVTESTIMFGTVVLFVGIGSLVSAGVSWRLSKRLGLLPKPSDDTPETPPLA